MKNKFSLYFIRENITLQIAMIKKYKLFYLNITQHRVRLYPIEKNLLKLIKFDKNRVVYVGKDVKYAKPIYKRHKRSKMKLEKHLNFPKNLKEQLQTE